jgi:hypothetical protein
MGRIQERKETPHLSSLSQYPSRSTSQQLSNIVLAPPSLVHRGRHSTLHIRCLLLHRPRSLQARLCPPQTAIILLDSDPRHGNDNVHALLLGRLPFVAVGAVLLIVPEGANSAVHATAAVLLGLCGRADVLNHGAVGDVLVGGLCGGVGGRGLGGVAGFADEGLEDVLLVGC